MQQRHHDGLERYRDTGEGSVLGTRVTMPAQRKDGSTLTVELTIREYEGEHGMLLTGWLRDITELVEARAAVTRSEQRLGALLANIISVIILVTETVMFRR